MQTIRGMFTALEVPNYRLLFAGRVTSNSGRTMRVFARAIWVFEATGSPLRMDTAITIRTMVIKDDVAYIQAGGGVVADSVPESEYQETLHKARSSLRAIEEAERSGLLVQWKD